MNIVRQAIKKAGTQKILKEKLTEIGMPVSQPSISEWARKGKVSVEYAPFVEIITGINRKQLCPDYDWDKVSTQQEG